MNELLAAIDDSTLPSSRLLGREIVEAIEMNKTSSVQDVQLEYRYLMFPVRNDTV